MDTDLEKLTTLMRRYMMVSSRTPSQVMRHKAVDLGFKLRAGFREHRWGRGDRTIAFAEFVRRRAAGKGLKIRKSMMEEYLIMKDSGKLSKNFRRFYRHHVRDGGKKAITAWQGMVIRELKLRTASIGSLGQMFNWMGKNSNLTKMTGIAIAKGMKGRPLGFLKLEDDNAMIVGFADAGAGPRPIDKVDERYGITRSAIEELRTETVDHLRDAHLARYREIFKEDPK